MITVLTSLWVALAALAIATWIFGMLASYREDDTVHLAPGEEGEIERQVRNERTMKKVERWRMGLSLSTVVGGMLVLGLYIYQGLTQTGAQFE
jgi:hypothetical protein